MSQLHRLQWIDAQIRDESYPNCTTIAKRFEISVRQASRDVEYLRYSMGAPLEYSAEHCGYFYAESTFVLPAGFLSETERTTLSYLAYRYAHAGSDQGEHLALLFRRIAGAGAARRPPPGMGSDTPAPAVGPEEASAYRSLFAAAGSRTKVRLEYRNAAGFASERVFHPYKVFLNAGGAYAVGYCETRRSVRVFRLSRVSRVRLLEDPFSVVPDYREADYGESVPLAWRDPFAAVVRFEHTDDLGATGMPHERVEPRTFRIEFQRSGDIIRFLLLRRDGFEVLSPAWLRARVRDMLARLLEKNS